MTEDLYIGPTLLGPSEPPIGQRLARMLLWPLLAFFLLVTIFSYVLFTPLSISGDSMLPSLTSGDRVFRTKAYGAPRRGDVVVIDGSPEDDIVKRIIAVGGDKVEIRNDIAFVNGKVESSQRVRFTPGMGVTHPAIRVPKGTVYVMGDNRPVSLDSRHVGPFPAARIRGRVTFVFLPFTDFGAVR